MEFPRCEEAFSNVRSQADILRWLQERKNNCMRLAADRLGEDRLGRLEDASYFESAILLIQVQAAPEKEE